MPRYLLKNIRGAANKLTIFILVSITIVILIFAGIIIFTRYFPKKTLTNHLTYLESINVDGGANSTDAAIGMYYDELNGTLYVTGFITVPGEGANAWVAKYNSHLQLVKNTTFNGSGNGDDWGYTMVSDGSYLFIVGYITEIDEGHNVWLAKYDTDLNLLDNISINGPANGTDDGYGILLDEVGKLYITGTLVMPGNGSDIFLFRFDKNLNLEAGITRNGPSSGTDKGRFLLDDGNGILYVSGSMSQEVTGYDIWIGQFDKDLQYLNETIIAGPTTGEDKGYGMALDETGMLYVTGTMTESGEYYNIWLTQFDSSLTIQKSITVNGPTNGEEIAYSICFVDDYLCLTGTYTEDTSIQNIYIAKYTKNLELLANITINGSGNDYDSGYGIIRGSEQTIYITGFITELSKGANIWIAHYDAATRVIKRAC